MATIPTHTRITSVMDKAMPLLSLRGDEAATSISALAATGASSATSFSGTILVVGFGFTYVGTLSLSILFALLGCIVAGAPLGDDVGCAVGSSDAGTIATSLFCSTVGASVGFVLGCSVMAVGPAVGAVDDGFFVGFDDTGEVEGLSEMGVTDTGEIVRPADG